MLKFLINTKSVQESNIFLRKLWSELNEIRPMGWEMWPYRDENNVTIGVSTLGEISYDYIQKGCIKNLYIDNKEDEKAISEAVQRARNNEMKIFAVSLELKNNSKILIAEAATDACEIFTHNKKIYLRFNVEAYSIWDLEQFLPNKYDVILAILYEYTQIVFDCVNVTVAKGKLEIENIEPMEYNYGWMDFDECPRQKNGDIMLPSECLKLISYIIDEKSYDENIELLVNSSRELMITQQMFEEIVSPHSSGKADVINSMLCSSLEPLSLVLNKNNEQCQKCGNKIFSITKKIKMLCERYLDKNLATYLVNETYKNRSVFLHVGQTESTQRAGKVFCPQINIETKMVMKPHGMVNYNLFDFSSYLFRNVAKDYFNGVLQ